MHRTAIRTTPFLSRARWAIALLLAGALATPGLAQTKGYAYTYCQAVVNHGNTEAFYVFSKPFHALPLVVDGQQRHAEVTEVYEQGRQEFKRYLQGRGFRLFEDGGPRCNVWPPSVVPTHEEALANLKQSMDSRAKSGIMYTTARPDLNQYTDFLPSFAKPIGKAEVTTPSKPEPAAKPTGPGGGIVLDSGPTPAERERHRQEQEAIAQRNLQREKDHARNIQQTFEAKQREEAQRIRQRVEAIHRDYDRRQAACKSGDTANCYAKVSAQ